MSLDSHLIELQLPVSAPSAGSRQADLSKFKPWVFRPKKVKFGLEESAPVRKSYSTSHWTAEENNKYVAFLMRFREVVEGERQRRRKWHLNRIMSKHIGTRSHEQCRSHHQKMVKHYKNIDGIIEHLTQTPPTSQDSNSERREEELPEPQAEVEDSFFNVLELGDPQEPLPLPCFDQDSIEMI